MTNKHDAEAYCCGVTHKASGTNARLFICSTCGGRLDWGAPVKGQQRWSETDRGELPRGTFWRRFEHTDGDRLRIEARAANSEGFCRETPFKAGIKLRVQSAQDPDDPSSALLPRYIPAELVEVARHLMSQAAQLKDSE